MLDDSCLTAISSIWKDCGPTTSMPSSSRCTTEWPRPFRDYVGATGTLIELTGKDAHRDWYTELLATYEVRSAAIHPACHDGMVCVQ